MQTGLAVEIFPVLISPDLSVVLHIREYSTAPRDWVICERWVRAANAGHKTQGLTRFTHFMVGGSDVVIASRSRVRTPDGRDRLRRWLLANTYFTVTDAISDATAAGAGHDVRSRRNSRGR